MEQIKTKFEVQGRTLTLGPVKTKQVLNFANVMAELDAGEILKASGVGSFIATLGGVLLQKFMDQVIFYGQDTEGIKWEDEDLAVTYGAVKSFLSLNPEMKELSSYLLTNFISLGEKIASLAGESKVATG